MKQSTKAVLLSALVFPGSGHLLLKRYRTGVLLAGIAFAAVYYLMSKTVELAIQVADKIQSGEVPSDVMSITELVSGQSTGNGDQLLAAAPAAFVICWLIGVVDSYRAGCAQDRLERSGEQ